VTCPTIRIHPAIIAQAAEKVTPADVAEAVVCGPDPKRYREAIDEFGEAGFDHVYIHQVGPDQESSFDFARSKLAFAAH